MYVQVRLRKDCNTLLLAQWITEYWFNDLVYIIYQCTKE